MAFIKNPHGTIHQVPDASVNTYLMRPPSSTEDQENGLRYNLATDGEIAAYCKRTGAEVPKDVAGRLDKAAAKDDK